MIGDKIINGLKAEFPREAVSWRAQSVTQDGTKALALAYIDARDVQNRLDEVVGPFNWKDRFEFHGARTICYIAIRFGDEWIEKGDGAGDSDVEAEKGAISDALKRAAVKWGIGRYLYDMPSPWVPCESYERNGKKHWKKWAADPWQFVKGRPTAPQSIGGTEEFPGTSDTFKTLASGLRETLTEAERTIWLDEHKAHCANLPDRERDLMRDVANMHKRTLRQVAQVAA